MKNLCCLFTRMSLTLYRIFFFLELCPLFFSHQWLFDVFYPVIRWSLYVLILYSLTISCLCFRKIRVIRRPKTSSKTNSRPSSTVFGQIDKLFDDERKTRDSVSLHSLQFSIPSLHPSLTALNNIGVNTKAAPYETL